MKIVKSCFIILIVLLLSGCLDKNISDLTNNSLNEEELESDNTFAGKSEFEYIDEISNSNRQSEELTICWEKHEVIDESTHTYVYIEYPQVKGMTSAEQEKQVNSLLKESVIPYYTGESIKGFNLEMETSIEFFNDSLISVKYSGFGYYYGEKDVVDTLYAVNIDLKTASLIDVHELFSDNFRECLIRDVFEYDGFNKSGEGEMIDQNSHEYGYANADEGLISEMFDNYYSNLTNEKYYFSEDNFNLIVKVPSGATAYLELVAKYNDLKDYMKLDNELWDVILEPK